MIKIDEKLCTGCGDCVKNCPDRAIKLKRRKPTTINGKEKKVIAFINPEKCSQCETCLGVAFCLKGAIFSND